MSGTAAPPALATIDWRRPWLAPWRERGEALAADAGRVGLVEALNAATGGAIRLGTGVLRFVEAAALPRGEAYEAFIARTASVPTRANLHDFFNGLAWLQQPALKRRLNELQAAQIAAAVPGAARGAVRDALTLFDENAALLAAPPPLIEALRARDWRTLFVTQRARWAEARFELFGHALLEKLLQPRKAITAHVWVVPCGQPERQGAPWPVEGLTPGRLAGRPFLPLPVLGVPGWWPANTAPAFYDDATVFRAAQKETAARGPLF